MSAREWRAVREGETHAASKTSTNNTPESFIVGIGASGALLAGAAIVFVTLVGLVSFNVWPSGRDVSVEPSVELSAATPGGHSTSNSAAAAPVSAASGQLASTSPGAGPGVSGGGGGNDQSGGGKGSQPKAGLNNPPAATPPSTGDTGDTGGGDTSAPGTATKDPVHPVHPNHPNTPHQADPSDTGPNVPRGSDRNNDSDVDSGEPVTSKGPFSRPTPPPSSDSGTNRSSREHGNSRNGH